jgi:hypothetical protein
MSDELTSDEDGEEDEDEDIDLEEEEEEDEYEFEGSVDDRNAVNLDLGTVSVEDFLWLQSLGFSKTTVVKMLSQNPNQDTLITLKQLYLDGLGEPHIFNDSLSLFGITLPTARQKRDEESAILQSIYGSSFNPVSSEKWTIKVDIPHFLSTGSSTGNIIMESRCMLEFLFTRDSAYPFEPPLTFFKDTSGKIPRHIQLILSIGLYKYAKSLVGESMIFECVDWLQGSGAADLIQNIPESMRKLYTEPFYSSVDTPTTARQQIKSSGPIPKYSQLSYGVGVAVTLKEDQGTGRTVNGFVYEGMKCI